MKMPDKSIVPTAPTRRPFSLKELFVTTTLACVLTALMFQWEWTADEFRMLGLSCGGALLGMLLSRLWGGRGWDLALGLGLVGTVVGICLLSRYHLDLQLQPSDPAFNGAVLAMEDSPILLALVTLPIGLVLAVCAIGIQLAAMAILAVRPHDWQQCLNGKGAAALAVVVAIAAVIWNADRIRHPWAWPVRDTIQFRGQSQHRVYPGGVDAVLLSTDGQLVGIIDAGNWRDRRALIYRLNPRQELTPLVNVTPGYGSSVSFSPDGTQVAVIEKDDSGSIRIIDLETGREVRKLALTGFRFRDICWLPGNQIAVMFDSTPQRGDDPQSLRLIHAETGESLRTIDSHPTMDERLGCEYHIDGTHLQVSSLETGEIMAQIDVTNERFRICNLHMHPTFRFHASPDLRFAFTNAWGGLIKLKENDIVWFPATPLAFTSGNQIVTVADNPRSFDGLFPGSAPFLSRLLSQLDWDRVIIRDSENGEELARTSAVRGDINRATLSRDGSTLAVATDRCVYIFDVPKEYR